ncbi:diaminopimelate epimerase [candidate division WOR-3 bacterium]|nr:diaminopimelate epimerase [candidate division WOR-3 bacterium]
MKPIFFTKMEGSGNDFLLLDNHNGLISETVPGPALPELVKRMTDRRLGAGSDGVLLLEQAKDFPFSMKYFNKDGSEAALCLNGTRCIVSYAYRLGLVNSKGKFLSASGPIGFYYKNGSVSIEVQLPVDIKLNFSITLKRKKYRANYLRLGVPHCVLFVKSYEKLNIKELGQAIREHRSFKPDGTNVNFVKVEDNHLFVRTYERGIEDETPSCGSGVLASAYIATKLFITESPVTCNTKGGELLITIKDKLYLEGPAKYIYDGVYYL